MSNVSLTRAETVMFLVALLLPLTVETVLAVTVAPELRWLLPTSMLFPAGLLAGIAMRGDAAASRRTAPDRAGDVRAAGAARA